MYSLAEKDNKEIIDREEAEIRAKIERLQVENKEMRKQVTLRGKAITTDNLTSKVRDLRDLEAERLAVELKKVKLEEEAKKVDAEILEVRSKTNEIASSFQQVENQLKKVEDE